MKEKMKMKKKDFFIVDNKKVRTACLDLILEAFGRNQENFVATSDVDDGKLNAFSKSLVILAFSIYLTYYLGFTSTFY